MRMEKGKKFISPGAWFSMVYPEAWSEFEGGEGAFLFYNPGEWTGNFRISAYKGAPGYGQESVRQELEENPSARLVEVGKMTCAYSRETFEEDNACYTSHIWITGIGNVAFECSFTVPQGAPVAEAEDIISSLEVRVEGKKYPPEIIPVRLSEIYQINEAYEWVETRVKDLLKKDFQGAEADVLSMQQVVDLGGISRKKREAWMAFGIVLCVILANEADGMEWRTLMDGNREAPVLLHVPTGRWIDPMKLVWSKVKAGETISLAETYQRFGEGEGFARDSEATSIYGNI